MTKKERILLREMLTITLVIFPMIPLVIAGFNQESEIWSKIGAISLTIIITEIIFFAYKSI